MIFKLLVFYIDYIIDDLMIDGKYCEFKYYTDKLKVYRISLLYWTVGRE